MFFNRFVRFDRITKFTRITRFARFNRCILFSIFLNFSDFSELLSIFLNPTQRLRQNSHIVLGSSSRNDFEAKNQHWGFFPQYHLIPKNNFTKLRVGEKWQLTITKACPWWEAGWAYITSSLIGPPLPTDYKWTHYWRSLKIALATTAGETAPALFPAEHNWLIGGGFWWVILVHAYLVETGLYWLVLVFASVLKLVCIGEYWSSSVDLLFLYPYLNFKIPLGMWYYYNWWGWLHIELTILQTPQRLLFRLLVPLLLLSAPLP